MSTASHSAGAARLRSGLVDKGGNARDDDSSAGPVEGVYGTHGFYFQQRRGRLDLRALGQLDLEDVVRSVDVEPLQAVLENITFCNLREEDLRFVTDQHVVKLFRTAQMTMEYLLYAQEQLSNNVANLAKKYEEKKKSLLRKRCEVAELKQTSKQLKQQLKAKKRGIDALEEMLKEANRNSANTRRKQRAEEEPVEDPPKRTELLKFFVSGPEGLCVEFQSKSSSAVRDLKREVRDAFRSRRDGGDEGDGWSGEGLIRLLRHGRVMLDDSTLLESGLRTGDTLVALVDKRAPSSAVAAPPSDDKTQMMLNFMGTQQESIKAMTSEMRQGWETVVQALTQPRGAGEVPADVNKDMLLRMEDRWSRMEASFREGMNPQQEAPAPRRKYRAGELESDHDENIDEINSKMKWSSSKIINLEMENAGVQEAFKRMQEQHKKDMEEIRMLLLNLRPAESATAPMQQKITGGEPAIPRKMSRWSGLAGAQQQVPEEASGVGVVEEVVGEKLSKQVDTAVKVAKAAKKLTTSSKPKEVPPQVTVSFRKQYSKSLAEFFLDIVDVKVPREIGLDDLIFELRREVAEQADVMLARVTLSLRGQVIALGIDVPSGKLDPEVAADLAARGDLTVCVSADRPVTDAQLDVLVAQMERSQTLSRSREGGGTENRVNPVTARRSLDIYKQSLRYSSGGESIGEDNAADLEEEIKEEELWWSGEGTNGTIRSGVASPSRRRVSGDLNRSLGTQGSAAARQSLDNLLRNLNEKEGMTDDEVEHEARQLRRSAGSMSRGVNSRLRSLERDIIGAVSAAADSGSEDIHEYDNHSRASRARGKDLDASLLRLSRSWMSGTGGSLLVPQEATRRAYDDHDPYYDARDEEDRDGPLTRSIDTYGYRDDDGRDSVSRRQAKLSGHNNMDHLSNTATSVGSLDVSNMRHADLERTVDTDISMPHEMSPRERARQYEDAAAGHIAVFDESEEMKDLRVPMTPSPSKMRGGGGSGAGGMAPASTGNRSTGSGSPFFHMGGDDTNDGESLALSESHETFADLDGSSRSIDYSRK